MIHLSVWSGHKLNGNGNAYGMKANHTGIQSFCKVMGKHVGEALCGLP
jgi:hypothetical protein